jgi:hypothetical protein
LIQIRTPGLNQKRQRVSSQKNATGTLQLSSVSKLKQIFLENKLYIIGGWLGAGPLAADDLHILDLDLFKWLPHQTSGESPGPCNMHTADAFKNNIYVFRGGDGRDYLNDLHELNTETMHWQRVKADGTAPPPRANHSSSIIGANLYIFGGWDGAKRLNDLFVINLEKRQWL